MTPPTAATAALEDAFDLDPEVTTVTTIHAEADASQPCTEDGCTQSPTTGHTTGCAVPDSAVALKGCNVL
ncbi:hypothetical protein [Streptomyces sp. JJ38]|uniref:hypothetical protein n=1 Tax=Streptomyces sp. JJ38 TaxID=2738128 RepID=UPI001C584ABB|nr:hypothetical protein [Streptomyces sp. JJ38]MBW1599430.1 hypothetical protein [Streptomyces sp. JJ38]